MGEVVLLTLKKLCTLLELPNEVIQEIEKYKNQNKSIPDNGMYERLRKPLFQGLFQLESVDYECMAVLDWVFPGEKGEVINLSENTSLQKNMKRFLLDGHKVGWAKGHLVKL